MHILFKRLIWFFSFCSQFNYSPQNTALLAYLSNSNLSLFKVQHCLQVLKKVVSLMSSNYSTETLWDMVILFAMDQALYQLTSGWFCCIKKIKYVVNSKYLSFIGKKRNDVEEKSTRPACGPTRPFPPPNLRISNSPPVLELSFFFLFFLSHRWNKIKINIGIHLHCTLYNHSILLVFQLIFLGTTCHCFHCSSTMPQEWLPNQC